MITFAAFCNTETALCDYTRSKRGFLGIFAKLRKATKIFAMSARTEKLGSHWTHFHEIRYLSILRKYIRNIEVSLKLDKNNRYYI